MTKSVKRHWYKINEKTGEMTEGVGGPNAKRKAKPSPWPKHGRSRAKRTAARVRAAS